MAGPDLDVESYARLTRLIYASALDQARWQDFLTELTHVSGGVCTHLFGFDMPAGISLGLTAAGYAPEYVDSYNEYYGEVNSWAPGFANAEVGIATPSQWMCSKETLYSTEFYNDWVRPQENVAAGGGALIFKDVTRMLAFGGNIRLKDEEKLEAPWLRTVGLLVPHLQQAFEISRLMSGQSLELDLLHDRTIMPGAAVMVLADTGFLLYANTSTDRLTEDRAVMLDDHAGRLSFRDPDAADILEKCLKQLRAGVEPISATFVSTGADGSRYACRIVRFTPEDHPVSPFALMLGYWRPALLVTVSPVAGRRLDRDAFMTAHGLTATETDVAVGIAEGLSPTELAEMRSVSIHTIRNQLKSAMQKTGSHRQAELVRLVESSKTV